MCRIWFSAVCSLLHSQQAKERNEDMPIYLHLNEGSYTSYSRFQKNAKKLGASVKLLKKFFDL